MSSSLPGSSIPSSAAQGMASGFRKAEEAGGGGGAGGGRGGWWTGDKACGRYAQSAREIAGGWVGVRCAAMDWTGREEEGQGRKTALASGGLVCAGMLA